MMEFTAAGSTTDEPGEAWQGDAPSEMTEAEEAECGDPPEPTACEEVDWEHLEKDERRRRREYVARALAASETGDREFVDSLAQLALDALVKDARRRAYYAQLMAVGDAPGARLEQDKERAAAAASKTALAFRQDLRVVVQQEVRGARQRQRDAEQAGAPPGATPSVFREVVRTAEAYLRKRWGAAHPPDADELIESCATNVAAMLTFTNAHRAREGDNNAWWSILAHRTVSRCLLPKLGMGADMEELVQAAGYRPTPDVLQRRSGLFVAVILNAIADRQVPFEYRGVGQAIDFAKYECLTFERKERKARAQAAAEKKRREEEARAEEAEREREEAQPTTLRLARGVAAEIASSPQDGAARRAEKVLGQAHYQLRFWEILESTLIPPAAGGPPCRRDALRFWVLAMLRCEVSAWRDDKFTWKEAVELFRANDPAFRYEDSLPPGVSQEELVEAFSGMTLTEGNLRKFWSNTSSVVNAELIKCNVAIPW